jgi:hypothetical protein
MLTVMSFGSMPGSSVRTMRFPSSTKDSSGGLNAAVPPFERPLSLGPQVFKYLIEATLEVVEIAKRTPRAKTSHNDLLLYGCCNSNETLFLHCSPAAIISGHVRNDAVCFNGLANCNGSTRFTRSGPAARRTGRGRTANLLSGC